MVFLQIIEQLDSDTLQSSGGTHSKTWSRSAASRFVHSNQGSLTTGSNSTLAQVAANLGHDYGSVGSGSAFDLNKRLVGPSSSQLYLVRTMLELMVDQTASGRHVMRKDLDTTTLTAIETFLKNSFYWPYLLNFSGKPFRIGVLRPLRVHTCVHVHLLSVRLPHSVLPFLTQNNLRIKMMDKICPTTDTVLNRRYQLGNSHLPPL